MMTDILPGRLSLHEPKSMIAQRSLVCSKSTYCVTLIAPPRTHSTLHHAGSLAPINCSSSRRDMTDDVLANGRSRGP